MQATSTQGPGTPERSFERRLDAAVRAGAWLLFVPGGLLLIQWTIYLAVMAARPAWFMSLMGSGLDWSELRWIWLGGMVLFKLLFWLHLMLVLWGALWSSMLRKRALLGPRRVSPSPPQELSSYGRTRSVPVR